MPLVQEILFPVDFSPSSVALTPVVASMSQRLAAPVTLLRVLSPEAGEAGLQHAREKLAGFGGPALQAARREVVFGPPAQAIVKFASGMRSPLIMMPTRGESAFRSLLIGSVTAAVLHDVCCPVWTTAHREAGGPLPADYKSIVCAIDLGAGSAALLRGALELASDLGAQLRVVHSVPGVDPRFESAAANRAHAFLKATAADDYAKLAAQNPEMALPPLEIVEEVGLTAGIVAAAERHQADLLVIGRGVTQGVLGRLRTNAHELIRQSPCPVLSI